MASDEAPLRNLWYMAGFGHELSRGGLMRKMLLGEPVLIGRTQTGVLFGMRDICPHRGVPLSAGRATASGVECPYHGWQFRSDGVCAHIPSLTDEQDFDPGKIRVRTYPVREQDGLIWIYMAAEGQETAEPGSLPPKVPLPNARPRWFESQTFQCPIDHAVIGLMDPAHAPFVHDRWWWRVRPRLKEKAYGPLPTGFVMKRHAPSKPAYRLLGTQVSTEITFELPSTRFEIVVGQIFGRPLSVIGLTVCTPIDAQSTQVTQIQYWPVWLGFIKPFFMAIGRTFLGDDRRMVELQKEGLKFNPRLMLIQDADQPAIWYHRLKKAWNEHIATGAPFVNPVGERTLRWRS
ncbi:MAG: aromatic ring-hydroxylating dioxygenase subunit alpha [Alphaproteobacteria bacterium]|nr:aromatic ring-hydroxylating dioxygenase subunit alpha [Alphaproteobacteria bacterium]